MRDVPARSWEISSGAWCAWREDDGLVPACAARHRALRRGPDAAGPGNGARQPPRPVGLPPEGPSEAAAPQRRDPNDASRLLRIPAALLRPRPFALARVAGPGRKAWRAEGAPLKPWRSCNNPAHGAGSFPVPVSVGV